MPGIGDHVPAESVITMGRNTQQLQGHVRIGCGWPIEPARKTVREYHVIEYLFVVYV